jgi:hypothetical protein
MSYSTSLSRAVRIRIIVGLTMQPFVTACLAFITFPVLDYTGRALYGGQSPDQFDAAMSVAAGVGLVGFLVTFGGVLPILMWRLERGPLHRTQVLAYGVLLGNVPSLLIMSGLAASQVIHGTIPRLDQLSYGPAGLIRAIAYGSFLGVTSAAIFWWVAGRFTRRVKNQAG